MGLVSGIYQSMSEEAYEIIGHNNGITIKTLALKLI
jgi:hypothetical protein